MVKKKDTPPKVEEEAVLVGGGSSFILNDELRNVHPFMRDGFARFLLDKSVPDWKTYKKYYKEYTGEDY